MHVEYFPFIAKPGAAYKGSVNAESVAAFAKETK
jgi:hypothetical protein